MLGTYRHGRGEVGLDLHHTFSGPATVLRFGRDGHAAGLDGCHPAVLHRGNRRVSARPGNILVGQETNFSTKNNARVESIVGIKRDEVYIANIVKCRPPLNRVPEQDEAESCLNYLRNQVILVKPKIIVLLGSTALKNILGNELSITACRGKWIEKKGIHYMPTWHPAALLRDENKKIDFWRDLKLVVEKM